MITQLEELTRTIEITQEAIEQDGILRLMLEKREQLNYASGMCEF